MAFDLRNRGTCHPDGQSPGDHPAKDGRSFYCEEHAPPHILAKWAETAAGRAPQSDARDTATINREPRASGPNSTTPSALEKVLTDDEKKKADRTAQIKTSIIKDVNPKAPQAFAFLCRPIPPHNFYQCRVDEAGKLHPVLSQSNNVIPTEYGKAVMLPDATAGLLAGAIAELETLPVVQFAEKAVGPYKGYAMLGAAAVALGMHAWTIFQLRDQLLTSYQVQLKAQAESVNHGSHPAGTGVAEEPAGPRAVPDIPVDEDEDLPDAAANGQAVGYDDRLGADIPDVSAVV